MTKDQVLEIVREFVPKTMIAKNTPTGRTKFSHGKVYEVTAQSNDDVRAVTVWRRYWSTAVKRDREIGEMRKWKSDEVRPIINQKFTEIAVLMDRLSELDVPFVLEVINSARIPSALQRGGKKSRAKVFVAFRPTIHCKE